MCAYRGVLVELGLLHRDAIVHLPLALHLGHKSVEKGRARKMSLYYITLPRRLASNEFVSHRTMQVGRKSQLTDRISILLYARYFSSVLGPIRSQGPSNLCAKTLIPAPAEVAIHALDFNAMLLLERHKLFFLDAEQLHPFAKLQVLIARRARRRVGLHVDPRKRNTATSSSPVVPISPHMHTPKTDKAKGSVGTTKTLIIHRKPKGILENE